MANKVKLDVHNLKLLYELEKNSRASISKIAKAIGTSKEVANYRLKKLISSGFIKRFSSMVDYSLLNFDHYRLIINLYNANYQIRKEIIEELKKNKSIDLNVYLSSNWDLEINMQVKDPKEFYEFYDYFVEKYSQYIAEKNFYVVTKTHLFSHSYLHKKRHTIILGESRKNLKISENEEKLLRAIEENPRVEIVSLAEKLKISPSTANYQVKQLVNKGIIKGCIPILDKSLLGFNTYRVEMTLNNPGKKKEVIDYLISQHPVIQISELIGSKDLDFYIDAKTTLELDTFLEDFRLNCPYIKEFEVINVLMD